MQRNQDVALLLLVLALVGQGLYLVLRAAPDEDSGSLVAEVLVGDTLGFLEGYLEGGALTTIPLQAERGTVTVLFAFSSECAFCDEVAPAWGTHFKTAVSGTPSVRRIALTRDLPATAAGYARRFGWQVDPLSVSPLPETSREYSLVSRTPWVFVFDSDGVLRYHDHGAELERLDQAIATISANRAHHTP